ncbi:unnamed protein product [Caenorhabditis bovis]|uniref:Uncharacterized protein n=1 Tax=Caenorhabditis bovis TaxID=2654633 RepID=A0A8S1EGP2_9PELO|nr:unnamed protein product [Caenorhabditis bovis]
MVAQLYVQGLTSTDVKNKSNANAMTGIQIFFGILYHGFRIGMQLVIASSVKEDAKSDRSITINQLVFELFANIGSLFNCALYYWVLKGFFTVERRQSNVIPIIGCNSTPLNSSPSPQVFSRRPSTISVYWPCHSPIPMSSPADPNLLHI